MTATENETPQWFAIRTRSEARAEETLAPQCAEVYSPTETVELPGGRSCKRRVIPGVLFIKTVKNRALRLEEQSRKHPELIAPFWIYCYPADNAVQVISEQSIRLLRLLTAEDQCCIFNREGFREDQHVRVTGGIYEGYEGYVQRVKKNKHVIVKIEGVCMVMLPFIHPDLLQPID